MFAYYLELANVKMYITVKTRAVVVKFHLRVVGSE